MKNQKKAIENTYNKHACITKFTISRLKSIVDFL